MATNYQSKYGGTGNPHNEILYYKNMYEKATDDAGRKFASQGANKYYGMLDQQTANQYKNMNASALGNHLNYQKQQEQAVAPVNFDQYKTQTSTIDDISKKYGFDYSRDYAKRQAEAEAQAKRNANEEQKRVNSTSKQENLKAIDNNLMNTADGLDRDYFLQYMNQAQNQTNNGLNAGIASDQNLRLAMNRQAEMAPAYRDANLGIMAENNRFTNEELALADALGLINQEALAREDSLFNERLQQGFDNAQTVDQFSQSENQMLLNAALQQQQQMMNQQNQDRTLDWEQFQFGNVSATDAAGLAQQRYMFDNMSAEARERLAWDREMYGTMSATDQANMQLAYSQLEEEKRQFSSEDEWRRYTYGKMSETDRARLDADIAMQGKELGWRKWETEYMANFGAGEDEGYNGTVSSGSFGGNALDFLP